MSNSKKLLSLFSGCGGMDLGFEGNFTVPEACVNRDMHPRDWYETAGDDRVKLKKNSFDTVFANDILPYAEAAWKTFFKSQGKDVERIFHTTSIVELVKRHQAGEKVFPDNIDVVTGGFPCQDFSVAGKRGGFHSRKNHNNKVDDAVPGEESRGSLYLWMRQVIEITNPGVFVAENVKGLISLGDAKRIIEDDFRNVGSGYVVVPAKVLTAANYGVAQNRERIIFIGLNKARLKPDVIARIESGDIDVYPPVTHSASPAGDQHSYVNVRQVLTQLSEPEHTADAAQTRYSRARYCKGTQGQTEVNLEGLAPTIRAEHHGNIEYRRLRAEYGGKNHDELEQGLKERRLTVRECARIQSFPDEYEFVFTEKDHDYSLSASGAYKIIGNAVPPLMAFNLAKHLENIWDDIFK